MVICVVPSESFPDLTWVAERLATAVGAVPSKVMDAAAPVEAGKKPLPQLRNLMSPTVMVPVRELGLLLTLTEYWIVPSPLPLAPESMVIQLALFVVDHEQPSVAVTVMLPVPAFALRLAFGNELTNEALLSGIRAIPKALQDSGFEFAHPKVDQALRHVLKPSEAR